MPCQNINARLDLQKMPTGKKHRQQHKQGSKVHLQIVKEETNNKGLTKAEAI